MSGRLTEIAVSGRRGWLVELEGGGAGEAAPLSGRSRESFEACGAALRRWLEDRDTELPPSARFAVECAELDAAARAASTSVAALLAGGPVDRAPGSSLGEAGPEARAIKIKVGPAKRWPEQRRAIDSLAATRPGLRVRLDFNGSLEPGEAPAILDDIAAAPWPLDFVEDPVAPPAMRALEAPLPIAVDTLVGEPGGVEAALELGFPIAVIKPALHGLRAALAAARRFAAAGMTPLVSHLMGGPVALAACAELACAIGGELAHGVGPHPGLGAAELASIAQFDGPWLVPRRGGLR